MGVYPLVDKPFSQACENNKHPILAVLQQEFAHCERILEIGSGTGQHAAYFAGQMPWLLWQTSDLYPHHQGIQSWLLDAPGNALAPLILDVSAGEWPDGTQFDGIFTANSLHIMAWNNVEDLFAGAAECLQPGGILCIYGPFNYRGKFTSLSNEHFDSMLRQRDPYSGIRDFAAVTELGARAGLRFRQDYAMPANNRLLSWCKL
jgi:SAM-dependent methyltransferase